MPPMKMYVFLSVVLGICIGIRGQQNLRLRQALSGNDWLNDVDGDNIPGRAGVDYPIHASVPKGTSFRCSDYEYAGYFGDVETDCQAYHVCFPDGRNASFLCVNGTVFHQRYFVCDWWFHFDCSNALNLYELNLFRKVPLPVLPPVARRPFPGPIPQPQRMPMPQPELRSIDRTPRILKKPLDSHDKNQDKIGPKTESDKKEKENRTPQNMNPSPKNKYKNPLDREDTCNCQCDPHKP